MQRKTAVGLLLAGTALFGQQEARKTFEAASVKLDTSGGSANRTNNTVGQVMMTNTPLDRVVQMAYGVTPAQVVAPGWLADIRVDIAAKYPPKATDDDRMSMFQSLLEDRFQMVAHHEKRPIAGFALVVAKKGFKLQPAANCEQSATHNGGAVHTLSVQCTSLELLAGLLSRWAGGLVENRTAIDGLYSFELRWSNAEPAPGSPDLVPTLFDALQDSLGLRLQSEKIIVDVVVVDHMEKVPTEN